MNDENKEQSKMTKREKKETEINYKITAKIQSFSNLVKFDKELQEHVSPQVEEYIRWDVKHNARLANFLSVWGKIKLLLGFLGVIATPAIISRLILLTPTIQNWIGIYVLQIISLIIILVIVTSISMKPVINTMDPSSTPNKTPIYITIVFSIFLSILLYFIHGWVSISSSGNLSFIYFFFTSVAVGILAFSLVFISFNAIGNWLISYYLNQRNYNKPVATIVLLLYEALEILKSEKDDFNELTIKMRMIKKIGTVADLLENALPKQLESSDRYSNYLSRKSFSKVAATFRVWLKLIITPQQNARDEITKKIEKSLIQILLGLWGELEETEPEGITLVEKGWPRISQIIQGIIIGLIPISMILIFQRVGISIAPEMLDYLFVGSIIWAILSSIIAFDPLFKDKVASFKDIFNIFKSFPG